MAGGGDVNCADTCTNGRSRKINSLKNIARDMKNNANNPEPTADRGLLIIDR